MKAAIACSRNTLDTDAFDTLSAAKFTGAIDAARFRMNRPKAQRALRAILHPKPWAERYREYMESAKWASFRASILKKRGTSCERCGLTTMRMHIHHLSYVRFGNEEDEDVIVLCVPCHQKRHMDKKTFWK